MSYHQTLRWVLTEAEAKRLSWDAVDEASPWSSPEPWFVDWRRTRPLVVRPARVRA